MQNHRLFRWDFNLVMSFFCAEFSLMTKLRGRIAECLHLTTSGIDVILGHNAADFILQEVSYISKTQRSPRRGYTFACRIIVQSRAATLTGRPDALSICCKILRVGTDDIGVPGSLRHQMLTKMVCHFFPLQASVALRNRYFLTTFFASS